MLGRAERRLKGSFVHLGSMLVLFVIAAPAWANASSVGYQQLQEEKLRQEIQQLQLENERARGHWGLVRTYSPLATALVALLGVLVTIWKQIHESNRQRDLDRKQREADSVRRLDEKFTSIVTALGSKSEAVRAGAAVSIATFIKPEYKALHEHVYPILLANLKIQHSEEIHRLLLKAFNKQIRFELELVQKQGGTIDLDLSRCYLNRADLSGLDLSEADFAFAKLRYVNLENAVLRRAKGIEADFENANLHGANLNEVRFDKACFREARLHEANMVSAFLKGADLTDAQFQQAKMQGAHLDNAKLDGAKFEGANISDAFFRGATMNLGTLRSILYSYNWQNAHFDDATKTRLEQLVKKGV